MTGPRERSHPKRGHEIRWGAGVAAGEGREEMGAARSSAREELSARCPRSPWSSPPLSPQRSEHKPRPHSIADPTPVTRPPTPSRDGLVLLNTPGPPPSRGPGPSHGARPAGSLVTCSWDVTSSVGWSPITGGARPPRLQPCTPILLPRLVSGQLLPPAHAVTHPCSPALREQSMLAALFAADPCVYTAPDML